MPHGIGRVAFLLLGLLATSPAAPSAPPLVAAPIPLAAAVTVVTATTDPWLPVGRKKCICTYNTGLAEIDTEIADLVCLIGGASHTAFHILFALEGVAHFGQRITCASRYGD